MCFFKKKPINGFDDVVCPYCFEKFNSNSVHFRARSDEEGTEVDEIYDHNYQKVYFPGSQPKKLNKSYTPDDEDWSRNCRFSNVTYNGQKYSVLTSYIQPNGEETRVRICPNCHNDLKNIGLNGKNKVISVLGYTQVGKTHYITSLLDYLCNVAPQIGPKNLSCTFISGQEVFDNNRVRYRSGPLRATDVQYIEPIIIDLSFSNAGITKEVFISFYDFPGEATNDFLNRAKGKHVSCADAYMLLFDMTKTKTFWADSKNQDLKQVEDELEKISSDATVFSYIQEDVKKKLKDYICGELPINDKVFKNRKMPRSFDLGLMSLENKEKFLSDLETYASECIVSSVWSYFMTLISARSATFDANNKNASAKTSSIDPSAFLDNGVAKEELKVHAKASKATNSISEFITCEEFVSKVIAFCDTSSEMIRELREQKIKEFYVFAQALFETEKNNIDAILENRNNTEQRLGRLQVECEGQNVAAYLELKKGQNTLQTYKLFELWISDVFFGNATYTIEKPTALVGTKSDAIISVLDERHKTEQDPQKKRLYENSMGIMSSPSAPPSNSYYDSTKISSMDLCVNQLLFNYGRDMNLHAFMDKFSNKNYFAVSSLGTKHITNIFGEVSPEAHVNPRWVAEPLFWLLHQLGVID